MTQKICNTDILLYCHTDMNNETGNRGRGDGATFYLIYKRNETEKRRMGNGFFGSRLTAYDI